MEHICGTLSAGTASADLSVTCSPANVSTTNQYQDRNVAITATTHDLFAADQPACAANNTVRCWLIGDVYSFDDTQVGGQTGHRARPENIDPVQYCARLYDRYGREFVRGLNGNYLLVLYNQSTHRIAFITDRLATVPIYYAQPDEETVAFSSNIQEVPFHPAVETAFDPGYLHEYLIFKRTFGVKTPLEGIEELQPGAITTFDLKDGTIDVDHYWQPQYRPCDESFEWFVNKFTKTITRCVNEWVRGDQQYGILLSGGSDSRLVLAALDQSAIAFHMTDWMSREAYTTKRIARAADTDLRILNRDAHYWIEALDRNRLLAQFNGWFTQPYTSGFENEITSQVDGLLSGMYGDTLFNEFAIPSRQVSVDSLGTLTLPIEQPITTIEEYIDWLIDSTMTSNVLELSTDLRTVLEANIYQEDDQIIHHGVPYDSFEDLVYYGGCYPLSNDDDLIIQTGLQRLLPYRTPFLDNRLIDLSLSIPIRYRLRKNIVNRAIERLAPPLAVIPHSQTGVRLTRSFPVEYIGRNLIAFWRKYITDENPPESYMTSGPWINYAELLRQYEFLGEEFKTYSDLADVLPIPDSDEINTYYHDHLRGNNHTVELYTLITVLSMPVTKYLVETSTDTPDQFGLSEESQLSDLWQYSGN